MAHIHPSDSTVRVSVQPRGISRIYALLGGKRTCFAQLIENGPRHCARGSTVSWRPLNFLPSLSFRCPYTRSRRFLSLVAASPTIFRRTSSSVSKKTPFSISIMCSSLSLLQINTHYNELLRIMICIIMYYNILFVLVRLITYYMHDYVL